jgi:Flp pilus assembly protein TadG
MRKGRAHSGKSLNWAASRRFFRENRGYALTLTLVALPLIIGVAAWVIDASRVTNLHTDLQDAVDAMALAGARELDGRDDAIPRAKAAVAAMTGNTASFADGGDGFSMGAKDVPVSYNATTGAGNVTVQFLGAIPNQDDTPIATGACADTAQYSSNCQVKGSSIAEQSNNAKYVRVISNEMEVRTMFLIPGLGRDDVPVQTEAVATYTAAACDVTPIYICNPFEGTGSPDFNDHFRSGDLYAREFTMTGGVAPGNFGFLAVNGNGADVLRGALATNNTGQCFNQQVVTTEPGQNTGPVEQGFGTRFGIYAGPMDSSDPAQRPALNVRMGQDQGNNKSKPNPSCNKYDPEASKYDAMPLPAGDSTTPTQGGTMSGNSWDARCYWWISHGGLTSAPADCTSAPALPSAVQNLRSSQPTTSTVAVSNPSRYDIYRYELANGKVADKSPGGESGASQLSCYKGPALNTFPDTPVNDRRTIFAAVLNCNEQFAGGSSGGRRDVQAAGYARMFLTRPATDKTISLEVVDVSGAGGMGSVEQFLREEAELVR